MKKSKDGSKQTLRGFEYILDLHQVSDLCTKKLYSISFWLLVHTFVYTNIITTW